MGYYLKLLIYIVLIISVYIIMTHAVLEAFENNKNAPIETMTSTLTNMINDIFTVGKIKIKELQKPTLETFQSELENTQSSLPFDNILSKLNNLCKKNHHRHHHGHHPDWNFYNEDLSDSMSVVVNAKHQKFLEYLSNKLKTIQPDNQLVISQDAIHRYRHPNKKEIVIESEVVLYERNSSTGKRCLFVSSISNTNDRVSINSIDIMENVCSEKADSCSFAQFSVSSNTPYSAFE
jgi:hypothetical protein